MAGKKLTTRRHFLKSLALGSAFISYWPYNMRMAIASEPTNQYKFNTVYLYDERKWCKKNVNTYADSIKGAVTDLIVLVYGHYNGGTMGWKSSLIPHTSWRAAIPKNQLRALIAAMHSRGIRVHAAFNTCRQDATGGLFPPIPIRNKHKTFVDVHNPVFQEFISDLTAECAGQGVDGICLDYIRTIDLSNPAKNDVSIENIVRMVYEKVKIVNPNCIVSSTTAPYYDTVNPTAKKWGRKAINWANKGYQDIIFDMNYGPYHKNGVGPRLGKDGDPPHMSYIYEGRKLMNNPEKLVVLAGSYKVIGKGKTVPTDSVQFAKVLDTVAAEETIGIYTGWLLSNQQIALLKEARGQN